ncbi:hypothetical protein [uncultured Microbulbifer sp.]|uniref:hypothetical protein n=1 Tax=uncultured Microbulbifer sp. TaxID=348147 RepID=UPI0025D33E58|nr:hypothetical protein [uncultured Microbulbifer sp.]
MQNLLEQLGGREFVQHTVDEFYQVIGKHLSAEDSSDHGKQSSRQAQFLNHVLSGQPEPMHSARASFLARGLNPTLFEAMLEFLQARLEELGFCPNFSHNLVRTAGDYYGDSDLQLSIAC